MDKLKKLQELVVPAESNWEEEARWRQKNRKWLRHSQAVAMRILNILEDKGITQVELAERMGVSAQQVNKIVKGSENLSLETISKLETALNVSLFTLPEPLQKETFVVAAINAASKTKTACRKITQQHSNTYIFYQIANAGKRTKKTNLDIYNSI